MSTHIDYDSIPVWVNEYVSVPFVDGGRDLNGFDCYGLIWMCLKTHFGVDIPEYGEHYEDTAQVEQVMAVKQQEIHKTYWLDVHEGQGKLGDIATFSIAGKSFHVGMMLNDHAMLNTYAGCYVKIDHIHSLLWKNRFEGLKRHIALA